VSVQSVLRSSFNRRLLRSDVGISKSLWGEVCVVIGREKAAIAIVSTKDSARFRTSAGRYFHGMVIKAKADIPTSTSLPAEHAESQRAAAGGQGR
jgi:hypothetical protein